MHVSPLSSESDPNWNSISSFWSWNGSWNSSFQFLITAFVVALSFLYILRTAASKYFVVETNFHSSSSSLSSSSVTMGATSNGVPDTCAVCAKPTSKQCSGCKAVKYCSQTCQVEHWKSGHKTKCKELKSSGKARLQSSASGKGSVALVPSSGSEKTQKLVDKVLFPYEEFVKLFNWDRPIFPPCGLLNCGNSCFANVILQCLAHTRPLLAYLLDKGHRRDCKRNEWCFLCELQTHMERASRSQQAFSPINILSRLPSIGGNLGYGRQEDAHEFMRFAIDTMQSVCLDEHGGEKVIHPKSQETTLIQHIFGGQLQSQVICTKCNQVSNQYENMMDLTVEIQGDATSLEECLEQFTAKEWLHGENMYKCDGCSDYVRAWKRLTIHQAPNILTIALKRFQSGRFGKINKRITFPESLDLTPYMSEGRDGTDKYKLYAVVVHVDMLNASFFGHYICYTKGFQGDWYRIDDCKVTRVDLDEVLSQGAYMLLYSRVSPRLTCLKTFESATQLQETGKTAAIIKATNSCPPNSVTSNSSKPTSSNPSCSSTYPHVLSDSEKLDHTETQKGQLSRVDSESVDGSQQDFHSGNHSSSLPVSIEANGEDALKTPIAGNNHTNGGLPDCPNGPSEQSSTVGPDLTGASGLVVDASTDTSYNASATALLSGEKADQNTTVNGVSESNGKLEEHRSEEGTHMTGNGFYGVKGDQAAVACEQHAWCKFSPMVNGNGPVISSQLISDNMDCAAMDVDIGPGSIEISSDEMDVDYVEVSKSANYSCISNDHSEH